MPTFDYDLIVIGGGAAGLTASGFGALMGAKTALIEAERLGGDCTWTGCIPSKTLLKAARVAHQTRTADRYGLRALTPEFDFGALLEHVRQVQRHIYDTADAPPNMERLGVEVIPGRARFVDPHSIEIQGQAGTSKMSARYVVIAAGSRATIPSIPGLSPADYVTNETIFSLIRQPRQLVVLGAGPVGIEMSQAFQRLGSQVTVLNQADRILARDDEELSRELQNALEVEGVRFMRTSRLAGVQRTTGGLRLQISDERGAVSTIPADTLLIATGREAQTAGLNLEAAGVRCEKSGIAINRRCQTNVKHIYACGDITGKLQFTHMAEHMAKVAINNAILHLPATIDERHLPWCTFTDPELAHVGSSAQDLDQRGLAYHTYKLPFAKIDRAVTEGEAQGMLKVFASKRGKVYGVGILGLHAGELAGEYALAIRNGIRMKAIGATIHAYPTLALGNRTVADQWLMRKRTPGLVRWIQRIFGYRGRVVDSAVLPAVLICALLGLNAQAQDPAAPPPSPPPAQASSGPVVLKATTRLVQISVIAQDKKGQPVADLKKEDFEIKVKGQIQPISLFSVDSTGALPHVPVKLPPNVYTNRLEERAGTPASVTVLLLDALNTKFEDQAYAKRQVIKFLRQIQPGDRIGIYTLGHSLRVLHDYTTDSAGLVRKLSQYAGQNIPDLAASEPAGTLQDGSLNLDDWLSGAGVSGAEADFYTVNRVQGTLRAIEFIADHLARLPGRKNLIWVSGGFPLSIGLDDLSAQSSPSRDRRTFSQEIDRTVRAVNNANLAIYPVDARGLMIDPAFSAANRGASLRPNPNAPPRQPVGVQNQQTMSELASRTGGRAYYNTNDLKSAIRDAVQDARVTYTLGFYPADEKFDSKFHEIKLRVDRPGVSLRYRKGYFDFAAKPQDDKTRNAELRDAVWSPLDSSAIGLIVQTVPGGTPQALEVYIKMERSDLSLQRQDDRWAGRVDILFVQKDDQGRTYSTIDDTLDMRMKQPNYERAGREGLVYHKQVLRAPQARNLRVVVRDAATGSIGSVTIPLS